MTESSWHLEHERVGGRGEGGGGEERGEEERKRRREERERKAAGTWSMPSNGLAPSSAVSTRGSKR
jgi:hypothetical protein